MRYRLFLRPSLLVFLVFLFLLVGCAPSERVEGDGWVRQENPVGFSVVYPRGAKVETADDGRVVIRLLDNAGFALIQPFLLSDPETPEDWLKNLPSRMASVFPQAKVSRISTGAPGQADAELSFTADGQSAKARLVCVIEGMAGNLYAVAAPAPTFAAQQETLARIVASFRYTAARLSTTPSSESFYTWTEPNEGMFAAEVPSGWTIKGGLSRKSALDTRIEVKAASPDGRIRLVAGDADIGPYALPTEAGTQFGLKEGTPFAPGDGTVFTIRRYLPGLDFARDYTQTHLAANLPNVSFVTLKDRPDLAAALNGKGKSGPGMERDLSVGSVEFAATKDGRPWRGYCLAGTTRLSIPGVQGGAWMVTRLYGYVCDAEQEAQAQAALFRLVRSLRLTPDWLGRQQGMADTLAQSFRTGQLAVAESLRTLAGTASISNMTLGMTEYQDLERGQTYRHVPGKNVYWTRDAAPPVEPSLTPLTRH